MAACAHLDGGQLARTHQRICLARGDVENLCSVGESQEAPQRPHVDLAVLVHASIVRERRCQCSIVDNFSASGGSAATIEPERHLTTTGSIAWQRNPHHGNDPLALSGSIRGSSSASCWWSHRSGEYFSWSQRLTRPPRSMRLGPLSALAIISSGPTWPNTAFGWARRPIDT